MDVRLRFVSCAALILVGACDRSATVNEPIGGIPVSRQRTISRADLGFRWPLSVGVGTVACDDAGVVLFRTQGVTYLLDGQRIGARDIQGLRVPEPAAPPSNPLKRLKQVEREEAFRRVAGCEAKAADQAECRRAAIAQLGLSDAEWDQIKFEGYERRWPPLTRGSMSLEPLVAVGRALCQPVARH